MLMRDQAAPRRRPEPSRPATKTTMTAPITDTTIVSMLMPVGSLRIEEDSGEKAADERSDDAQDDGHQDALAGARDERRDEAGNRAKHDPSDDPMGFLPSRSPPVAGCSTHRRARTGASTRPRVSPRATPVS